MNYELTTIFVKPHSEMERHAYFMTRLLLPLR